VATNAENVFGIFQVGLFLARQENLAILAVWTERKSSKNSEQTDDLKSWKPSLKWNACFEAGDHHRGCRHGMNLGLVPIVEDHRDGPNHNLPILLTLALRLVWPFRFGVFGPLPGRRRLEMRSAAI
jgi:hypothetical protein